MSEITGPILAITLVLLSVFVPVAFTPGISGQLFRQFAVAVSISMLISALNALTLSPALCSVLLKRGQRPGRYHALCARRHRQGARRLCGDRAPAGAGRDHRRRCRRRRARGRGFRLQRTPQSFLPDEDQGAIFAACGCRKALRSTAPKRWSSRSRISSDRPQVSKACSRWSDSISSIMSLRRTRRSSSSGSSPMRIAPIARRAWARSSPSCGRSSARSRAPSLSRSTCRRSSASAVPAASNMCWKRCKASRRPTSPR